MDHTFIIVGDANIDITIQDSDDNTRQYMHGMKELNLIQLITSPTTINNSNIDHIWISDKDINHFAEVRNTYYSDHMPLLLDIN